MKLTTVLLFMLLFVSGETLAQDFPSNLLSKVPDSAAKLQSEDVAERISLLNELVVEVPGSCTGQHSFPFELKRADYVFVVGKIFEKDLNVLDEKRSSEAWHKLSAVVSNFDLKEFSLPISKYLSVDRWQTQASALAMIDSLGAKQFDGKIATLLSSNNAYVRGEALRVLVRFESRMAVPALIPILYSPDLNHRYSALDRLVRVKGREAVPHVAKLLRDEESNIRYWALDALVKFDAKERAGEIWVLTTDPTPQTQAYAIAALVYFDDAKAISKAAAEIAESTPVGIEILNRVTELKAKAITPSLISILENPPKSTPFYGRTDIVNALGRLGAKESSGTLRKYLSAHLITSRAAAQVLGDFRDKDSVDDLLNIFFKYLPDSPNSIGNEIYQSADAAVALAKIGDSKTWKVLIDAAENPKYPYRSQIIQELNIHINPSLWKRVESAKVSGQDFGTIKVNAEGFASETKIPIVLEYDPEQHFFRFAKPGEYPGLRVMPAQPLQTGLKDIVSVIDSGTLPNRFTYILDGETVRILTVENAIRWWRTNILKPQTTK